jgi:parallel beta-helix repeat protein
MTLAADIATIQTDTGLLHQVVHGSPATSVSTEGGMVPSLARVLSLMNYGTLRGAWATGTAYAANDIVTESSLWYRALSAHTSGATFAGDLSGGKWMIAATTADALMATATGGSTARNLAAHLSDSLSVLDFGAVGDGVTDDTTAFNNALATLKPIYAPPGTYVVGDVAMPAGSMLHGRNAGGYGSLTAGSSVLKRKAGCTRIINRTGWSIIRSVAFDGVDKTCVGIGGAYGGEVSNCYIQFCTYGINAEYHGIIADSNTIYGCTTGIRNPVDSRIHNNTVAASTASGVILESGANDNIIAANKLEWNEGYNLKLSGANHNTIVGNVIDRGYVGGIYVGQGAAFNTIAGNMLRRNGRNDAGASEADAHFILNNCDNLVISGNATKVGVNDDGSGANTPKYVIKSVNACSNLVITGNDFTGFTSATCLNYSTQPTPIIQRHNLGVDAQELGTKYGASGGRQYLAYAFQHWLTAAATEVALTVADKAIGTYSRSVRRLVVMCRNTTTQTTYVAEFHILVSRGSGSATVSASAGFGEIGTAGAIGIGGGTVLSVTFTSVAADASTYELSLTNINATQDMSVTLELT